VAKKKKPAYLGAQASWRRDLIREIRAASIEGDDLAAGIAERKLRSEEAYLKESIKLLRRFVAGFEAADGYDLNDLAYIPEYRLKRVRQYAPIIRKEISGETERQKYYKVVRPRTRKGREALEKFTGQRDIPRRKGFVVHIEDSNAQVSLVSKTVKVHGRKIKQENVEVVQHRGRMVIYQRFFRFPEPPATFADVIDMTRKMLRFMPRGWYVIETSNYGAIHAPIRKEFLLKELQDRFLVYDVLPETGKDSRGLAETVVGYRLVGMHSEDADREYTERITRRMAAERFRRQQRAVQRRRSLRRIRGF
jgi:hypothetical protein